MRFSSFLRLGIALCATVLVCLCSAAVADAAPARARMVSHRLCTGPSTPCRIRTRLPKAPATDAVLRACTAGRASPCGKLARAQPARSPARKRRRRAARIRYGGGQRRRRSAGGVTGADWRADRAAVSLHDQRHRRQTFPPRPSFVAWLCLILSAVPARAPAHWAFESIRAASGTVLPAQQPR